MGRRGEIDTQREVEIVRGEKARNGPRKQRERERENNDKYDSLLIKVIILITW